MSLVIAQEVLHVPDVSLLLEHLTNDGFDYAVIPLTHPLHHREGDSRRSLPERTLALTRTDTILPSYEWSAPFTVFNSQAQCKFICLNFKLCYFFRLPGINSRPENARLSSPSPSPPQDEPGRGSDLTLAQL